MPDPTPIPANPNSDPANGPSPSFPPGQTPPQPRKRKRRWLAVLGILLVLLLLLILLAPTIASMGFVRSIVAGKVNDQINGSVEIGDYSVGWLSGITASDVKVYDSQKNLILQLNKFTSSLSLLNALRGNLALGDTTIDVDLTRVEIGDDGQLNYAKLARQEEKHKSSDSSRSPEKPEHSTAKPIQLPAISGKLTINYKGTLYQNGRALAQIQPSTAVIDIPNINQPITNDISLSYSVNNGPPGTLHIAGSTAAVKNGSLDTNTPSADEKLDLTNLDLKALSAFLPILSPSLKLQTDGTASGSLALKADGVSSIFVGGEIDVSKFAASGQPLKGTDRVAIDRITIPLDFSRTSNMKDGQPFIDIKHADVLLNDGQLGKITLAAYAPQDALLSAAALVPAVAQRALLGTAPSPDSLIVNGEGTASITADLDVAALASQLPATLGLQPGTQLTQGHLSHLTTIAISKDTAKIDTDTRLPDLKGTTAGKPVELSPIEIAGGVSAVGGDSPDLRDLTVHLSSAFLNASGGGATLSQEKLTGSFDLANLQAQASQFVDLDALLNTPAKVSQPPTTQPAAPPHVQLAGAGTFDLSTDGDLIKPDGQGKVATSLTITGINASGIGRLPPIKLANLNATLSGDLHRSAASIDYKNFAAALTAAGITVQNKNAAAPAVLDNETITANLNGNISLPTGDGSRSINLAALDLRSSSDLFGVLSDSKTPDALTISEAGGEIKADGAVAVNVDLKKLDDLIQRFSATSATAPAVSSGQVQSGQLNGTLKIIHGDLLRTDINFNGDITDLTVATAQKPIRNETVKLSLHAIVPDDGSAIKADGSLDSRFASAKLQDAILELNGSPGTWDMLQHAQIDLNVPDLPAAYDILNAFSPPTAQAAAMWPSPDFGRANLILTALDPPPAETPAEAAKRRKRERAARRAREAAEAPPAPIPPLQITGGSMAGHLTLRRDAASQTTTLDVSGLTISKLAIARGDSKYAFTQDVAFGASLAIKASDDAGKSSPIDEIQQIQLTQLNGNLPGANVTLPDPITITNPADLTQIDAHGSIKIDGNLADATPLLAVLQGAASPMPYAGTYSLAQTIHTGQATQGKLLNLVGTIDVTNFQVLDNDGKTAYTEPSVTIKNDLDYVPGKASPTTSPTDRVRTNDHAIVRTFTLDMPGSHALNLTFVGRIADPFNKRIIRGLGTDPAAKLDVTYDLAKLWPIVKPMLAPDVQEKYKDLKVVGQEQRSFTVSGYFPMARTMAESIHHLNADGGFALDELDLPQGLTITKEDLPFTMTAGVIHTSVSAHPQTLGTDTTQPIVANTAICNQGAIDLSDLSLDLGQASPVLTIPKNHKLLQRVHLNPVLAGTLGAGNLLFKDATAATGLMNVTVVQCDAVPLGDLITSATNASATILYSVSDLSIDGPVPQVISSGLKLGGQGIHGGIDNGQLTLANGEVQNDFSLNIIRYVAPTPVAGQPDAGGTSSATPTDATGQQLVPISLPLGFSGGVSLTTGNLKNFVVSVPQGLLPSQYASLFPSGLTIPFTGTSSRPTLDTQKALTANAGGAILNGNGGAGNLLDGFLGKHKKQSQPQPTSQDSSGQ